tara:strand:+ start:1225 stop:1929 length:705 start_codon:yes stop_codon:yes gene_type:complete
MKKQLVNFKNVTIQIDSQKYFNDVNISIEKGEFVFLIGKTGSGKSSLLKSIYGEKKIIEGDAFISDFNLCNLKKDKIPILRRRIGIIFQDFKLLNDRNVFNNLLFVLRSTGWKNKELINERIMECLEKVHITKLKNKLTSQLSGGETQKVAICRALLNNPEIIIADEPTGNLDPMSSIEIMEILKEINNNGNTILVATHDFELLKKYGNRFMKCTNGNIELIERKNLKMENIYK